MKRIFLISLAVMLLVACLAVPAFAAESYAFTWDADEGSFVFDRVTMPARSYVIEFNFYDSAEEETIILTSDPFVLDVSSPDWFGYSAYADVTLQHDSSVFGVELDIYEDSDRGFIDCAWYGDDLPASYVLVSMTFVPYDVATTDSLFSVFSSIGTWCVAQLGNLAALFYVAGTGLTFLGVLSVAGLGIGVVFLVVAIVARFLRFRR